jgi:hypothetical protein
MVGMSTTERVGGPSVPLGTDDVAVASVGFSVAVAFFGFDVRVAAVGVSVVIAAHVSTTGRTASDDGVGVTLIRFVIGGRTIRRSIEAVLIRFVSGGGTFSCGGVAKVRLVSGGGTFSCGGVAKVRFAV